MNGLLALALTAGMLAPLNPCGFALLPAWIAHTLGDQGDAGPDVDCEPQQARGIPCNLQLDETLVTSQTDLNQAEGGRECHFERFMQAA